MPDSLKQQTSVRGNYVCPQCAAVTVFNPASHSLSCQYCGWEGEIEQGPHVEVQSLDYFRARHKESFSWGKEKKSLSCQNCGAQVIYEALQISGRCPFCGSTHVMEEAVANSIAPTAIIPFAVSEEKTEIIFRKWVKKKFFTPEDLKKKAKAHHFRGIYLPLWIFDYDSSASYQAQGGKIVHMGRFSFTAWSDVEGVYNNLFKNIIINASHLRKTVKLEQLKEYNLNRIVPYNPQYLSGFLAERYSIGLDAAYDECVRVMDEYLETAVERYIKNEHNKDEVKDLYLDIDLRKASYKLLMVPIWFSHYEYNGKAYDFSVNGQTGSITGKTPESALKKLFVGLGITLLVATIIALAFFLLIVGGF